LQRAALVIAVFVNAVLMASPGLILAASPGTDQVQVLSSRPDAVSGGDVLIEYRAPASSQWSAALDGHDVTRSFQQTKSGEWRALLTGLEVGENSLTIRESGAVRAKIKLINHPLSGPIFSGPHQKPFICETVANGLGPATDADCDAAIRVEYFYKSTVPVDREASPPWPAAPHLALGLKPYDPTIPLPADVATTVTVDGHTVPFIVRREMGVINRAVYDIEFLHEPGSPLPSPWREPNPGWNGRLVYIFGGGCGGGNGYHQGKLDNSIGAASQYFLADGFAVATSTLNLGANNCDTALSAETLSMVKEHFTKEFGGPVHTMGWGGSGGSIAALLTAQNYPGLLDGIIASLSFPDPLNPSRVFSDCALLSHAFGTSRASWTDVQRAAVSGYASGQTCTGFWSDATGLQYKAFDPRHCPPELPKELAFDASSNPGGARCDMFTTSINGLGRNPRTGLVYRPVDNEGVQYGLLAFNRGQIGAEQFLELNQKVGGFNDNGDFSAERSVADPEAVRRAYERGFALTGDGDLGKIPIIDWRPYADDLANHHDSVRTFIIQARLLAANGTADNEAILRYPRWSASDLWYFFAKGQSWEEIYPARTRFLATRMSTWLDSISADHDQGTQAIKVARNKPTELADGCWAIDGARIVEHAAHEGTGRCNQLYPIYGDPRIAAGGPLTDDVLKCALKPLRAEDYSQQLSADQLRRLNRVFPTGVCNYDKPGIGQSRLNSVWQRF
jgi:hypothetical protein